MTAWRVPARSPAAEIAASTRAHRLVADRRVRPGLAPELLAEARPRSARSSRRGAGLGGARDEHRLAPGRRAEAPRRWPARVSASGRITGCRGCLARQLRGKRPPRCSGSSPAYANCVRAGRGPPRAARRRRAAPPRARRPTGPGSCSTTIRGEALPVARSAARTIARAWSVSSPVTRASVTPPPRAASAPAPPV